MKIVPNSAGFVFDMSDGRQASVLFLSYRGKPSRVDVMFSDAIGNCKIPNERGDWKPCVTHSKRLIEQALKALPKPSRVEKRKAKLKIYRG